MMSAHVLFALSVEAAVPAGATFKEAVIYAMSSL